MSASATPTLSPLNDLETMLVDAQDGKAGLGDFLNTLLAANAHMLVDQSPESLSPDDEEPTPLVVRNHEGQALLALFTAPERAVNMTLQFPQYAYCVEVKVSTLFMQMAPGFGIAINPGTDVGLEMPAEGVDRIRVELQSN